MNRKGKLTSHLKRSSAVNRGWDLQSQSVDGDILSPSKLLPIPQPPLHGFTG